MVGKEDPGDGGYQEPFFHTWCLFGLKEYEGWHRPGGRQDSGQFIHLHKQVSDHIDPAPAAACQDAQTNSFPTRCCLFAICQKILYSSSASIQESDALLPIYREIVKP